MSTQDELAALLDDLVPLPGLSGHEESVLGYVADALRPHANEVWADAIGNVIARFGREDAPRKTAVLAHMDTVGFLVKTVSSDGMLRVVPVGGVNVRALPGTAVHVATTFNAYSSPNFPGVPGVIGVRSQHLARAGESLPTVDDLVIEVDPAVVDQIEVTAPVLYTPQTVRLGEHLYAAPYLDNRAGCAVLIALGRQLKHVPDDQAIYLIGSVQEETTCLGALAALQRVRPDRAIFIDGTLSYDTPETSGLGSVRLGGGPVLTSFLYVSGLIGWHANQGWREHLKVHCVNQSIPYQQDAVRGLMSDARAATQLGIPSVLVGIPMRGKHSPLEMVHLDDLANVLRLVTIELGDQYNFQ
jgi:putative aminopeptidase FrvX